MTEPRKTQKEACSFVGRAKISSSSENTDEHNAMVLRDVLDKAEKAVRDNEALWDKKEQSLTQRNNHRPNRNKVKPDIAQQMASEYAVLKRHSPKVAEALLLYERRVDKETEIISESNTSLDETLIDRAQKFLHMWRMSLDVDDNIHCPDYLDEFDCDDDRRRFVKYYRAKVVNVALEGASVALGDTSEEMSSRRQRLLGVGEKAISVRYTAYDTIRWILLSPPEDVAFHVVPRNSHLRTVEALQKLHLRVNEEDNALEQTPSNDACQSDVQSEQIPRKTQRSQSAVQAEEEYGKDASGEGITSNNAGPPEAPFDTRSPAIERSPLEIEESPVINDRDTQLPNQESIPKRRKRNWASLKRSADETDDHKKTNEPVRYSVPVGDVKPRVEHNGVKANNPLLRKDTQRVRKDSSTDKSDKSSSIGLLDAVPQKNGKKPGGRTLKDPPTRSSPPPETDTGKHVIETETTVSTPSMNSELSTPALTANRKSRSRKASAAQTEKAKKPPAESTQQNRKRKKKESDDDAEREDFTWICTECKEAECPEDPDSPLMLCEGKCNRPFHHPCAGLASLPPGDKTWICNDCVRGQHQCVVCQQYGVDDDDVFCCSKPKCGRFFHESCLTMYNVEVDLVDVEVSDRDDTGDEIDFPRTVSRPRFKCPAHQCWTCTEEFVPVDESEKDNQGRKRGGKKRRKKSSDSLASSFLTKKGRVYPCLECPIAYHSSCIPPVARFHELALLCHEHASTSMLPDLDVESSFQGQVEAHADKKLDEIEKGKKRKAEQLRKRTAQVASPNLFFPGLMGNLMTTKEDDLRDKLTEGETVKRSSACGWIFCLPCDYKKEVHSKPPAYRHVHTLRYDPANRPKRRPPSGEACQCKSSCDEHCLNRMVMMECVGDANTASGGKNPYWNCNLGAECGNRSLGLRNFAKCRPQREQGKGWGLISINGVKKGDLVQEYTGEVIDEQTKKERLEAWARDHPNDPNYYVMYLDTGWYIDARNEANMSRFINHSCNPNCKLLRVNVGGYMHVAIYCCRDVAPGEFLSYDYQFDTKHGDKFVCRCGASNCRGTLAGKDVSLEEGGGKKTKKQARTEAKARFDRDKKFLDDLEQRQTERLWQVGMFVPAATTKDGTETVASGPQERYRDVALRNRLFLWRTAIRGANLAAREFSLAKSKSARRNCSPLTKRNGKIDIISLVRKTQERQP